MNHTTNGSDNDRNLVLVNEIKHLQEELTAVKRENEMKDAIIARQQYLLNKYEGNSS